MGIKPGDSSVVIAYQVDDFTCTWSAEQFVAHSYIYPGFTSKVSSLTHFPLEPGCMPFWIRLLLTLNKDWTPSSLIHLKHWNWTLPWRSLMPLHLQSLLGFSTWLVPFLIILSHSLLLAFVLINCGARLGLFCAHVSLATKMSTSKLIHYFSSHPAAFGFWAPTPPENISLNSANRKVDQSLSDFQTGLGAAGHATLDTEQLISCLQVALVDTFSSLPEAEGDVIPMSEVHELLLQFHGILDKAVSKQVGNSAHILAHLFNSVSRQCCEVWASQFPFLHSLKEVIPPSEVHLYGCINWSLAQAHSVGLSQSFPCKRDGKARPWTGFQFTVQKRPMSGSMSGTSGASLPKWPHLESGNEAHLHGKKSAGGTVSTCSTESRRKGGHGGSTSDVPQPSTSSSSSPSTSAVFQVGMLFKFLISGEALHPTGLCLIRFGATIFSLDPILPCSVTTGTLMSRQLQLIILLLRRRLMSFLLREQ